MTSVLSNSKRSCTSQVINHEHLHAYAGKKKRKEIKEMIIKQGPQESLIK